MRNPKERLRARIVTEGYQAYVLGLDDEANPYIGEQADLWNKGWRNAAEEREGDAQCVDVQ